MPEINVAVIELLCLVMMAGVNVYLAVALIRGLRTDDSVIELLASRTEYVAQELTRLARVVRARQPPPEATTQDDTAVAIEAFNELQQSGFQELSEGSRDAYDMAKEISELKEKELAAWKDANRDRIERLLAGQATMQRRLSDAQETLDASAQTINALQQQNEKLGTIEIKAKLLDEANRGLEIELSKLKNHAARTNAEIARVRLEAATAKKQAAAHELEMKALHEKYLSDREQLISDKHLLEMRLNALQETFNRGLQVADDADQAKAAHEQFMRDSETLQEEKKQLEEKLNTLQSDFDRTLVEKAFIESVLLDMDSALRYSKKAIPGNAAAKAAPRAA